MIGPNLLEWATKVNDPLSLSAECNLFSLARAILADEEDRKQTFNRELSAVVINEITRLCSTNFTGENATTKTPEPPSE